MMKRNGKSLWSEFVSWSIFDWELIVDEVATIDRIAMNYIHAVFIYV